MSVESQCHFEMYSAKCFLEVNNGVSGNNRIRQGVPVAYDSIAELILCNVKFKLRGFEVLNVYLGCRDSKPWNNILISDEQMTYRQL